MVNHSVAVCRNNLLHLVGRFLVPQRIRELLERIFLRLIWVLPRIWRGLLLIPGRAARRAVELHNLAADGDSAGVKQTRIWRG